MLKGCNDKTTIYLSGKSAAGIFLQGKKSANSIKTIQNNNNENNNNEIANL